ncbi:MAG: serine hydrolase [Pseudomonadales bacterium]|nr:serine hydrolase [Pseudomonadales bacterium]
MKLLKHLVYTALFALLAPSLAAQQVLPPPLQDQPSDVPVAVQILRWHMLDNDVSTLAFREMDKLFTTRKVSRSGPVWQLPHDDHALDFSYAWQGKTYRAEEFLERTYTNALLVMKDGRVISEIYRNNSRPDSRFIGWSMTKSVTSILIGCALEDGHLDALDTPVSDYIPELTGGGYEGVSIRHVMQMRSGVDYEERYDFENPGIAASNHISSLVKNNTRFADVARTLPRIHEPGTFFQYKTLDTALLGWLLERSTGMSVAAYTERCLWEPLGAEADGYYIMDGPPGVGREFSGAGFNATLRDYARFGQMVLNEGLADGRRIVSAGWILQSTRPSGEEDKRRGGYGLQWWTMADNEAFSAIGLQGQYIYIDPDTNTVVVKLSYFPPGDNSTQDGETQAFMAAASNWQP